MSMPSVRPPTSNPADISPRTTAANNAVPGAAPASSQAAQQASTSSKKKKHRAGRKHKSSRRKSIVSRPDGLNSQHGLAEAGQTTSDSFYLQVNNSNTSLESEALLDHRGDHRDQSFRRPRRASTMIASPYQTPGRARANPNTYFGGEDSPANERAPLLASSARSDNEALGYGGANPGKSINHKSPSRQRNRRGSSRSSGLQGIAPRTPTEPWNVNYPPSVPGSPTLDATDPMGGFRDVMMHDDDSDDHRSRRGSMPGAESDETFALSKSSLERRHTVAMGTSGDDVCMPQETLSEMGEFDMHTERDVSSQRTRRRRRQKWPDLELLEDFSRLEKESRSESNRRVKKIAEPQLIEGRLRPANGKRWFTAEEEAPYRFTYFNIDFEDTIHSQTISELPQAELGFKELFLPDAPLLSDSSDDETDDEDFPTQGSGTGTRNGDVPLSRVHTRTSSIAQQLSDRRAESSMSPQPQRGGPTDISGIASGMATPSRAKSPVAEGANESDTKLPSTGLEKQLRYGDRPVWWLDVYSPTQRELELLSKAFGIHPLTTEDIWLQEEREKVELFRNYYFITYQSFDQDSKSDNFMEPLMMYIVVFREGVISFHWNPTPHPANVRRRIRFLKDYVRIDADWIGYGIIDDVTDVYIPLIQNIEDEVDDIDDAILKLHSTPESMAAAAAKKEEGDNEKADSEPEAEGHLLHRVGACRKKVMRLYRLLGTKADVIKGFAKRCNEKWQVAPRSDIGMYLGDIQDHIVTMTGNLSHYDVILARCHANYIAQINIRMGERQEATADGLNKLTVLGTIVLPMNIITGLWGMNVWVPGQEDEGYLGWFFLITAGLLVFGVMCYFAAKRLRLV